jgi:predicted glycosyltransferase
MTSSGAVVSGRVGEPSIASSSVGAPERAEHDSQVAGMPVLEVRNRRGRSRESVRIAMYSHDTLGLGHTRRNLLIATALTRLGMQIDILLITGTHATTHFALPPGADCLTLPSLRKDLDGSYASRSLSMSLRDIVALRSRSIWAALKTFKPDLLIVDNVARGAAGELDLSLRKLRKKGRTRCVLGLRDVLDAADVIRAQWAALETADTLASFYDAVWVYGDASVYDTLEDQVLPDTVRETVRYLGYFDPTTRRQPDAPLSADVAALRDWAAEGLVLCLVGGGQDGWRLAEAFTRTSLPAGMRGVLVTGPFMHEGARRALQRNTASRHDLRVVDFLAEPSELLPYAARVISMGGYNTVLEVLAFERPLLMIPRVLPRREQWIRATRLSALGLLEMLHPDDLTADALASWLRRDAVRAPARERLDFGAATRIGPAIEEVLGRALVPRVMPREEETHAAG